MYPDFNFFLKDLFGIDLPALSLLKSFGFMVAMAFLAAGYIIFKELKRKEEDGIVGFTIDEITIGKPITIFDYISTAIIGFLIGFKVIGMFLNFKEASPDPMSYLFSSKGNLITGVLFLLGAVGIKYFTRDKTITVETNKKVKTFPSSRVGDVAVIAALGGFAGAKIFNALETWDDFISDPLGSLLSSSGLTFYGGLIVATFALWYFARRIKLDFRHLCDAAAPALILGYAIGRLGCQVSGDGDWGIYNSAYMTDSNAKVVKSTMPFEQQVALHEAHVYRHFKKDEIIPHKQMQGPDFLPTWLFAYTYPNNVNNVGEEMAGCEGNYCSALPIPVFPTPAYEFLMGFAIFLFLWICRKKMKTPLTMFSIYLILNGVERFLIEQIRVNSQYDWGFIKPTQAEILAVCIALCGMLLFAFRKVIDGKIRGTVNTSI